MRNLELLSKVAPPSVAEINSTLHDLKVGVVNNKNIKKAKTRKRKLSVNSVKKKT